MKSLVLTLFMGRDELGRLFAALLKHRSSVRQLRSNQAKIDKRITDLNNEQDQNTTDLKATILSYNETRAALVKSFDL